MHAGRVHGGGYRGGLRPTHPIAGVRPGRPGYPVAGRPGRPIAGYPGGYYPRRGYGAAAVGAAAVGAAAAGAYYGSYGYDNSGCYQNANGYWVCPQQYPY